jgi:hypothetical protein
MRVAAMRIKARAFMPFLVISFSLDEFGQNA